jgi:hypothetical protein
VSFFASDPTRKIQDSRAGYSRGYGIEVNLNTRCLEELDSVFRAHADSAAVESAELAVAIRLEESNLSHASLMLDCVQMHLFSTVTACIHVSFF